MIRQKVMALAAMGVLLVSGTQSFAGVAPVIDPAEARLAALVAELQRQTAAAAAARPRIRPREIEPGVRIEIPTNPALQTPAEKAYLQRWITGVVLNGQISSARSLCQQAQSYTPYDQFGRLQAGWISTHLGPQLKSCY